MRFTVFALVAALGVATDSVGQDAIVQPVEIFEESPVNVTEDVDAMELGLETMTYGHHKSSTSTSTSTSMSEDMSMSMSMSMSDDGDFVGDNGEHGMTGCIYQTAEERCAIYQTYLRKAFEYDKQLAGTPPEELPEVIPVDPGAGGPAPFTERKLKFSQDKDAEFETQSVPWFENRELLCYGACGIRKVCPEDCHELSDIENYCSAMDVHVKFDPNCGFCTDTCRSSCISFVAHCCPCNAAKLILNINAEQAFEESNFILSKVADVPGASGGAGGYVDNIFDTKKGFGLLFTDSISKYYYTSASQSWYWCRSSFLGSSMPDVNVVPENDDFEAIREGLYKWKYDPNIDLSEDLVFFEGLEEESGSVYGKGNATFRLIFKDSVGWHISENTFGLNTNTTIRAASPEMLYNGYIPDIDDYVNNEAGTTFGPSKPSFNCIDCVGFRLDAVAKKMYQDRELETETAGEEGPADIVEQDEEVEEMLWRPKPPKNEYLVLIKKFLVEAKPSTVQWRHLT